MAAGSTISLGAWAVPQCFTLLAVLCSAHEQNVQRGSTHFYMGGDRIATLADAGSNQLYIAFTVLDSAWPGGVPKRSADGQECLAVLGSSSKASLWQSTRLRSAHKHRPPHAPAL